MKSFIKFLVTLIVAVLVGSVVYYLLINGSVQDNNNTLVSGDNDIVDDNFDELENKYSGEHNPEKSGDGINGGGHNIPSGDNVVIPPVIDPIEQIDEMVQVINSGDIVSTLSENLDPSLINETAKDFLNYFNQTKLAATVNLKKGMIEIIPTIDFLENQIYYFDEEGNLILYEKVSNTVEGVAKYYFDKGENIKVVNEYEDGVTPTEENATDILNRASALYSNYAVK